MKYLSVCAIAKDETPYLEEWVCMNLAAGVEHFYIYDNSSKVPIKQTLKKYIDMKLITVMPVVGFGQQLRVYNDCLLKFSYQSKFIAFIDCDEFFCLKDKQDLKVILKPYESYGGLAVNWMLFGSSGHLTKPDGWVVETMLHRAPESFTANNHVKTIVNTKYRSKFIYNPHSVVCRNSIIVNENRVKVIGAFSNYSYNQVRLNHYFTKSLQEFEQKINRGKADKYQRKDMRTIDEFYWNDKPCSIYDDEILKLLSKAKKIVR